MADEQNPYAAPLAPLVDHAPQRKLVTEFTSEMKRVRAGLGLVYFSICATLLIAIGVPALTLVMGPGAVEVVVAGMGLVVAMILFAILMLVGQAMCIAVPSESGAKGLVVAAVALQVLSLFPALLQLMPGIEETGRLSMAIQTLSNLLSLAATICFILFMRRTAIYINRGDVARRGIRVIVAGVASLATLIAGVLLAQGVEPMLGLLAGVGALGLLFSLIMYANMVTYLRKAIVV